MRLIVEHPRTSQPIVMLARKNGRYSRPILGFAIDVRMEDMPGMADAARAGRLINYILPLPPVGGQAGRYALMSFGSFDKFISAGPELDQLIATNRYLVLPDSPRSQYWELTKAPWWEYAEVQDEYGGIIKAPLHPREGELSADEVDESIDEFEANRGRVEVLAPATLQKQMAGAIAESYVKRLRRL